MHQNRGTGAGGANTNANGLHFENTTTDLSSEYSYTKKVKSRYFNATIVKFKGGGDKQYMSANQANFQKVMKTLSPPENTRQISLHGAKRPDEVYIDKMSKRIIVIEKKMQMKPGSVCEKIQTPHAKKWSYNSSYPGWKIEYVYTLSNWFKQNCKGELEYLRAFNIPVFWGESDTYKEEIVNFIVNV